MASAGALGRLGEESPYTLVLVIDQAEEIFTLARPDEDGPPPACGAPPLRTIARLGSSPATSR